MVKWNVEFYLSISLIWCGWMGVRVFLLVVCVFCSFFCVIFKTFSLKIQLYLKTKWLNHPYCSAFVCVLLCIHVFVCMHLSPEQVILMAPSSLVQFLPPVPRHLPKVHLYNFCHQSLIISLFTCTVFATSSLVSFYHFLYTQWNITLTDAKIKHPSTENQKLSKILFYRLELVRI